MANLDWSECPTVESIPGKRSGAWVFKGTRMPVSTVFENLESGASIEEIMEWFDVTRDQVTTVLEFAARSLDAQVPPAIRCSPSMRILFDHGTPAPLIPFLEGHTVTKAKDAGWDTLVNGELLKAAEMAGFDLLLTTDKNMGGAAESARSKHCDRGAREFAMADRATYVRRIAASVNAATPGICVEVDIPFR